MIKRTLFLTLGITLVTLFFWELHWRSEGYPIAPEDDKHLYAEHRGSIEKLGKEDVVLLGSSRVLFDIQLDEFESVTGRRPVMLAGAGTNPIAAFIDIVEKSDFSGKIILGVTPPLFFSPPTRDDDFFNRAQVWLDHYHNRTLADQWTHMVKKPLQNSFAFLCATDDTFYNELDLRTLLEQAIKVPERVPGEPPFPMFQYLDWDRNITMWRADKDTAYASDVTEYWSYVIQPPPEKLPPPEVMEEGRKATIQLVVDLVNAFESRGGEVILVRCPSSDLFLAVENGGFPRDRYWDPLVSETGCQSYHFQDYPFMNQYIPPEWSHLNTEDARQFTLDLTRQMVKDGVLESKPTNP